MRLNYVFVVLFLLFSLKLNAQSASVGHKQKGMVAYYADKFHGKKTASGEIFNNHAYTAAHRTFPFNTMLKVTHMATQQAVIVRVNDRGPFARNRILDISKIAAQDLGILRKGSAMVEIEVMPPDVQPGPLPKPEQTTPNETQKESTDVLVTGKTYSIWLSERKPIGYGVQVFAFKDQENAVQKAQEIAKKGIEEVYLQVGWQGMGHIYRILLGQYATKEQAQQAATAYRQKGYNGFPKPHFK